MSEIESKPANLCAGEFYGTVPAKRSLKASILSEVVHKRAFDVPEHSHELAYFTLVLGGAYSERFGRKLLDHAPMSLLWHREGVSHKDSVGECGSRMFTVEIKNGGLESLRQYATVPLDFVENGTPMVWLATRLFREFKRWGTCSELVAEGLTLELLGQAGRHGAVSEKRPPVWLASIKEKLRAEFASNHSTSALATEANVHPVHLASVFRKFYGQTIGEFLQNLRVSHATRLLLENDMPLIDIAYSCGFADQSHFNRLFKRHTGTTPAEFKRSLV